MSQLNELTKIALLGTQRTALPELGDSSPIGELLAALDGDKPEQKLLKMAGTLGLYEQVGQLPQQIAHIPDSWQAPPPDERPSCSPALAMRLSLMLDGRFRNLLPECLKALNQAGLRLPDALLPNFLEHGGKSSLIRPSLLPVIGRRGRWLAAQNDAWAYASTAVEHWDSLTKLWAARARAARHSLLRQLRHTHPRLARELLESAWKSEPQASRSSFIRLLEFGLSIEDEPFLEAALDDRDFQIRRKAAELLTYLPQSRLCQRMAQASRLFLRWEPKDERQIVVTFPVKISDQLARDGVNRDVGKNAARGRARQLMQLVSAIPLDWWEKRFGATPEEIMLALETSRWPRTLTQGLTTAVQRQKNVDWALALLKHAKFVNVAGKLIPILPLEECEAITKRLDEEPDTEPSALKDSPLLRVLRHWQQPWDEEMGRFWIDFVAREAENDAEDKPGPFLRAAVKNFARVCPPQLADTAVQTFTPLTHSRPGWRMTLNEMTAVLTFRQAMYDEIS
ncbi:MAG: hypothetical protein GY803_00515 [Chloroflexi bacterium]|nr:hypothetical protein [Chloroflexota bacterium]